MLENLCLQCTLTFIGAGLLGLLLGRLLFGGKSKALALAKEETERYKANHNNLLNEFKNFKSKSSRELEAKNKELLELSKRKPSSSPALAISESALSPDENKWRKKAEKMAKEIISMRLELEKKTKAPETLSPEKKNKLTKKWKEKVSQLKDKVAGLREKLEVENRNNITAQNEIVSLHAAIDAANNKIKKQDALILEAKSESFIPADQNNALVKEKDLLIKKLETKIKKQDALLLEAKRESFSTPQNGNSSGKKKKIKRLRKEVNAYKQKVKALKAKLKKNADSKKVVETIDIKKLNTLIKNGTLVTKKTLR